MRVCGALTIALVALLSAGCGDQGPLATRNLSGVTGRVQLGPTCPVETAGDSCGYKPAKVSRVSVAKQVPGHSDAGELVARTTSDADGAFRIALSPGRYVVTADAGMSCEPVRIRITPRAYSKVDILCDTGIR